MLRISSWMAIVIGALLSIGQVVRNVDDFENWPNWGIDVLAGAILAYGGYRALKKRSDRSLAAAWAFAAGLFLSAFVSHYQALAKAAPDGTYYAAEERLAAIVGALMAVSLAGVAMSLLGKKAGA